MSKKIFYYLFLIAVVFTACKKDDDDDDGQTNTGPTINSVPQFGGKIDTTTYNFIISEDSIPGTGINEFTDTFGVTWATYHSQLLINDTVPFFTVSLGRLEYVDTTTESQFTDFFAIGNRSYTDSATSSFGASISWLDGAGTEWSTLKGTANQSGSTFKIDDMKTEVLENKFRAKVKASFNCTLYDGNGNSVPLTNGVYVGYFTKFH